MEVQATQITVDEAGDDIGAQAATGNAEARKKKSDVVTTPKKAALAITGAAETDLISDLVHEIESADAQRPRPSERGRSHGHVDLIIPSCHGHSFAMSFP